uniref:Oxysterol-binding protein 1 n=1 Tax=Coccidioides posadasii RMSCC 3488 TaxID=454284 RepID=A0A0J6ICQ2_COCPO|nr:oxysterol-binding protein 1 [Coccidioides posadasii RMSCC 3488]
MGDKHEGHKRSKSALALSILHRDKSKSDDGNYDKHSNLDPGSPISTSPSPVHESRHSYSASMSYLRPSRRKAEAEATSSQSSNKLPCESPENPTDLRDRLDMNTASTSNVPAGGALSIEQSVRTFRLFEILRDGDTTAISKAIKECRDSETQNTIALGTSILHLAIQCAEPQVVEYVLSNGDVDVNARDRDGNTPLHLAAQLGRLSIVKELLDRPDINDGITNFHGQTPLDLARTPEIFQQLQLSRSLFIEAKTREIQCLVAQGDYEGLENLLVDPRVQGTVDVNSLDLVTDRTTALTGGTLLHEATRKKDSRLIQILLMNGADPFRRDRKGKLPQDVTKDDRTKAIVKRSPAAVIAQQGIQERSILGSSSGHGGDVSIGGKDAREMKGYLKKWTNYTGGYKLRWFVLEDGVMSYYKHQDDAGSACRGAINMRIAKLNMDPQDKTRFEIQGKSSVKYHLKANHVVEAKRWFWALNNAIQWAKDEAKEDDRRRTRDAEVLRQARMDQFGQVQDNQTDTGSFTSGKGNGKTLAPPSLGLTPSGSKLSLQPSRGASESGVGDEEGSVSIALDPTYSQPTIDRIISQATIPAEGDADDDDYADYDSSREVKPSNKDAFNITAQSVKLQLDLLGTVSAALQAEKEKSPNTTISDPSITQALTTYEGAVSNLNSLVLDLLKISRDRDAYWQYRLEREADARKMWEDSMARIAQEHEELQNRMGESEDKRKRTKKALKEALESASTVPSSGPSHVQISDVVEVVKELALDKESIQSKPSGHELVCRRSILDEISALSESEEEEEEFFDAIDAGEVEVVIPPKPEEVPPADSDVRALKQLEIEPSYKGYEDPIRKRLKMDDDNRPKISLWGILKSMIGKDMTKMTLPVSFNEPTSLLQRVAEDMEYTDLLDVAADRANSLERMIYVAAFAASEYASTIGRVAKPFNPLLGETYEYVRPDKGFRFFIEQVSHHPPIGAAYAESAKWDYYGESAVKSKFYGKSFDINPLGTWFLKLRPVTGGEELYTWKKVTSSVIGIITGSPTVDNYGPMTIKNWTTGEVCNLDFKPRGWTASSAYQVTGKVLDRDGVPKWSIGGRWNDKIYARHTPGYHEPVSAPQNDASPNPDSPQAFLVWQANPRPTGIPFNLTPFVVTLNAIPESLRPFLPPTDTRLRPDQRAMEDGEYDFAATEKHRVEEKQRAKRRKREAKGEEFVPKWFSKGRCGVTGEEYWVYGGKYWKCRDTGDWSLCEDIF